MRGGLSQMRGGVFACAWKPTCAVASAGRHIFPIAIGIDLFLRSVDASRTGFFLHQVFHPAQAAAKRPKEK